MSELLSISDNKTNGPKKIPMEKSAFDLDDDQSSHHYGNKKDNKSLLGKRVRANFNHSNSETVS